MKLLVLGGTEFVGRAVVEHGLDSGGQVTVLNRGTTAAPSGVTALVGDRGTADGLSAVNSGEWDVVVDTWSWAPSAVRDAADLLAGRVDRYVYVSSRSVYDFPTPRGADEGAPVVGGDPGDDAFDDYARAKRGGELAVLAAFGDRALLARAGLILGPHENIGRLPWWLNRIAQGGRVLAPAPSDSPLQYVDARDLAAFVLAAAERGVSGPVDVVSTSGFTTMGGLLNPCISATGSSAELVWLEPAEILGAGIEPWTELPIWMPNAQLHDSMHGSDTSRAIAAGLGCRPVEATVADTWSWLRSIGGRAPQRPDRPAVGLDRGKEDRLLTVASRGS